MNCTLYMLPAVCNYGNCYNILLCIMVKFVSLHYFFYIFVFYIQTKMNEPNPSFLGKKANVMHKLTLWRIVSQTYIPILWCRMGKRSRQCRMLVKLHDSWYMSVMSIFEEMYACNLAGGTYFFLSLR